MVSFPFIAVLWLAGCWSLTSYFQSPTSNRKQPDSFLLTTLVSAVFCMLWHWRALLIFTESGFYPSDSIYTLGPFKATALACLTAILLLCAAYTSWRATNLVIRRVRGTVLVSIAAALINGIITTVLYWLFLSLVPQLYYLIYLQIFPNLPNQLVVEGLIPIKEFVKILLFLERPSLSIHAAGLLGWVLFTNAVIQWLSAAQRAMVTRA